jgi:hypothetical protein
MSDEQLDAAMLLDEPATIRARQCRRKHKPSMQTKVGCNLGASGVHELTNYLGKWDLSCRDVAMPLYTPCGGKVWSVEGRGSRPLAANLTCMQPQHNVPHCGP